MLKLLIISIFVPVLTFAIDVATIGKNTDYVCVHNSLGISVGKVIGNNFNLVDFDNLTKKLKKKNKSFKKKIKKTSNKVKIRKFKSKIKSNSRIIKDVKKCTNGSLTSLNNTISNISNVRPSQACQVVDGTMNGVAPVINGESCFVGDSPIIKLIMTTSKFVSLCTGTAISPRTILTAAHCLVTNKKIKSIKAITGNETVKASAWFTHPNYDPKTSRQEDHDIAIINLSRDISSRTLKLLGSHGFFQDENAIVTGYGQDNNKKTQVLKAGSTKLVAADKELIVTASDNSESSTCFGDSGGPLLVFRNNTWIVGGVLSTVGTTGEGSICITDTRINTFANVTSASNKSFIISHFR